MPIECKVTTISTWLAPITVVETARGVRFVDLDDGARQFRREAAGEYIRVPGEAEAADELRRYFAGELHVFSVPLDLCGTPFQLRCWEAMRGIPYGQTITYAQEGLMAGTRGFQAVGQANRKNPVPILVPCHRVVSLSGPGGYFGGRLDWKKQLLEFEGCALPADWDWEPRKRQNREKTEPQSN